MKRKAFRAVLLDTLPVMTGYLVLGAGFGILLNKNGFGIGWSFFMSQPADQPRLFDQRRPGYPFT